MGYIYFQFVEKRKKMAAPTANFPDVQRIRDIVRNELAALLDSVRDYHEDTSFIFTRMFTKLQPNLFKLCDKTYFPGV
jgi:hypothetical protein